MKKSLNKQEEVVSALWEYARLLKEKPANVKNEVVAVNIDAVRETTDRILEIFGYEPVEIQ